MTRATNPTGSMLLDRSAAQPGSIDKSVFEKKSGSSKASTGQGTVNSNYLKECREDNPEPATTQDQTKSVTLGACKITTPPENLVVDQPFEMSVEAKSANGAPSGQVSFRLFCTIPDPAGGPPKCEDQSLSFSGTIADSLAKASGKLISPKKPVPAGTKLQYHVVAEHPEAKEKSESPKVEVESGKPPKPVAVWSLGAVHFGFDSSFILPSAAAEIADFKAKIEKHPGAALAVFGHADPVGEDDNNKGLSGRRAFAVWCLLAKDSTGWTQLANSDKWDLRTTQTMLAHLKNKTSGQPYYTDDIDGKTGPNTESAIASFRKDHILGNGSNLDGLAKEGLFKTYMESVCEVTCKREDFVGDPKDAKRQWACVGCSEFNPVLVFGKCDDAKFRNASDKTERNAKNAANRRATVFLFPPGAKGPGNVEFPCPQWSEGAATCRKQFFEDADKRRNPSDAERTWEKDKDTFACRFYAEICTECYIPGKYAIHVHLVDQDGAPLKNTPYKLKLSNGSTLEGITDENGHISHPDNLHGGEFDLIIPSNSVHPSPPTCENPHFIEIKLVDSANQPLRQTQYRLKLSDGSVLDGRSDGDGFIRYLDNTCGGPIELTLLDSPTTTNEADSPPASAISGASSTAAEAFDTTELIRLRFLDHEQAPYFGKVYSITGNTGQTWSGSVPESGVIELNVPSSCSRLSASLQLSDYDTSSTLEWNIAVEHRAFGSSREDQIKRLSNLGYAMNPLSDPRDFDHALSGYRSCTGQNSISDDNALSAAAAYHDATNYSPA